MQRIFYALTLFSLIFIIGCGDTVTVKGTAKMADGTPIEAGTIIFRSDKEQFSADIQPNGTFSPGKLKDGDGITPGVYQIGVMGVRPKGADPTAAGTTPQAKKRRSTPSGDVNPPPQYIHSRYADVTQSGLTIDTSKTQTLDLVLDPP